MDLSTLSLCSRRTFLKLISQATATGLLLSGCATAVSPSPTAPLVATPQETATIPPTPQETPTINPSATVSLDFKIGQMLIVGFRGLSVDANSPIVQDIRERHLGGVVLFDYDVPTAKFERNIASPPQLKALIAALQSFATTPLLVTIDQEGGQVSRLRETYGFPATMSHQALGTLNDLAVTREQSRKMAQTLKAMGVNLNLAPVVDLNVNPNSPAIGKYERSFSADPKIVTEQALTFIEAHHAEGVLCTLKHFPGHGSATADTHRGFVDVTTTWSRTELEPYRALITAKQADAIMTAHVFNATLDPDYPATLSHSTITQILREELHYDGVVITDDMQMGAIRELYGFETAIQKTIEAGVDVIAIANNLVYEEDVAARTIALIKQLVTTGVIPEVRIDESYQRIQQLKSKLSKPVAIVR